MAVETTTAGNSILLTGLSKPQNRKVEPVGKYFLAFLRRRLHNRTFSEDDRIESAAKEVEEEDVSEEEEEDPMMLQNDPNHWKSQDHYAVLGLSRYRYKATDEQIKKAHRRKVLKHHPDKKASSGNVNDDSFFKCIQKAMDVLSDPVRRRQFDSVDEGAEPHLPKISKKSTDPKDFFKLYKTIFDAEARFSTKHPVPSIGDMNSEKGYVEDFYNFWYNFDSWRTFEYLDKEEAEDTDNRDNKRHRESKNKAERAKRKREDNQRLRKVIDDALAADPRWKKFKEEEKKAKEKRKWDRDAGSRKAAEDKKKAEEEAKLKKEQEEAAQKAASEKKKGDKEAQKKAAKKDKRIVKGSVKDVNYFQGAGTASASDIDKILSDVELVLEHYKLDDLTDLATDLEKNKNSSDAVKDTFSKAVKNITETKGVDASKFKYFA